MKNWTTDEVLGLIEVHPEALGNPRLLAKALLRGYFYHKYDVVTQRTHFKVGGKKVYDVDRPTKLATERVKRRHARLLAQLLTEQERTNEEAQKR